MGCSTSAPVPVTDQIRELLSQQAPLLLRFISQVDCHISLYISEKQRSLSIQRYELLWLPLLISLPVTFDYSTIVPPLDVYFVWYCHMLCSEEYRNDILCMSKGLKEFFPHRFLSDADNDRALERCRSLWQQRYGDETAFELDLDDEDRRVMENFAIVQGVAVSNHAHITGSSNLLPPLPPTTAAAAAASRNTNDVNNQHDWITLNTVSSSMSLLLCDLHTVMRSQQIVHYQYQLPHYLNDIAFQSQAIELYIDVFLDLCRLSSSKQWLPTFAMQWIWYAHLCLPQLYAEHCLQLCGRIVRSSDIIPIVDIEERVRSWQEMDAEIVKRKFRHIYVEGGHYRGDPTSGQLSTLLLQRLISEYEGYYPRDVYIEKSFGRGWNAIIERMNSPSIASVSPPCMPTTLMKRYQNMDVDDKIEEDHRFDQYEQTLTPSFRALQRFNLSIPRLKRWSQLPGGLKMSALLSVQGVCLEFFLKNDMIASVHSLTPLQCRHSLFEQHCFCQKSDSSVALISNSADNANNSDAQRPNSFYNVNSLVRRCQTLLVRIAGHDQVLLHGEWASNSPFTSSTSTSTATPLTTSKTCRPNSFGLSSARVGSSNNTNKASHSPANTPSLLLSMTSSSALDAETEMVNIHQQPRSMTVDHNDVEGFPLVTVFGMPFQEMQTMVISHIGEEHDSRPIFELSSVCRFLGHDNVDDSVIFDIHRSVIQGERNAPPVLSIVLGMSLSLLHVILRPNDNEHALTRESFNPFFIATGSLFPITKGSSTETEGNMSVDNPLEWSSFAELKSKHV
jgi:hypothetical protein